MASLSNPGFDDDPTLTGDLLEIYFSSSRTGSMDQGGDIWTARRASPTDAWGDAQPVVELSSPVEDQSPGITADGLTIYFTSRRPSGDSNFWVSTRPTRTAPWSPPTQASELSTPLDEFEPQPDPSHLRLVLYRQQATNRTLFETARASTASPWPPPAEIPGLDTQTSERSPCLADDARQILFGSDRTGPTDVHDLYLAVRPSVTEPFGAPTPISEVNSIMDDDDPWLSPDGHVLVFSSTRSGNSEIWEARR